MPEYRCIVTYCLFLCALVMLPLQAESIAIAPPLTVLDPQQVIENLNNAQGGDWGDQAQAGSAVVSNGDYLFIGAPNESGTGAVYVYEYLSGFWNFLQKIKPSQLTDNADFGAALALSGSRLIVGAPLDSNGASESGSVYIFNLNNGIFVLEQLIANSTSDERFGISVSAYGSQLAVGAPEATISGSADAGKVYVYETSGSDYSLIQTIQASGFSPGDLFGFSVSLDYEYLAIGAPGRSTFTGSVFMFYKEAFSPSDWSFEQEITASAGNPTDFFGRSISLLGSYLCVGAMGDSTNGSLAGAVYLFENTGSWYQVDKYLASDGAANQTFGLSVSMGVGTFIVGAPGLSSGACYVFEDMGEGLWDNTQTLLPESPGTGAQMGSAVHMHNSTITVGARHDDTGGTESGAAYAYSNFYSEWSEDRKFISSSFSVNSNFGGAMAASNGRVVIGRPTIFEYGYGENSGYVSVYKKDENGFYRLEAVFTDPVAESDSYYGSSVAIDGDVIVVGDPQDNYGLGGAYIYKLSDDGMWQLDEAIAAPDSFVGFGTAVAIQGDTVLVTAPNYIDDYYSEFSVAVEGDIEARALYPTGAIYVFQKPFITWQFQTRIIPTDDMFYELDGFYGGHKISFSGDTFITTGMNDGYVIYQGTGPVWNYQGHSLNGGYCVDIQGDMIVMAGYYGDVEIHRRVGDSWDIDQSIEMPTDGALKESALDISSDGNSILVGLAGRSYNSDSGVPEESAYLYQWDGLDWVQTYDFRPANEELSRYSVIDEFAWSAVLDADCVLIGAPTREGSNGYSNAGAVDVYALMVSSNQSPGPISDIDAAANEISYDASVNTPVGITAYSIDPDDDTVIYSLSDDASGRFQINSSSGVITSNMSLSSSGDSQYNITVVASDGQLAETQTFSIAVLGESNTPPSTPEDINSATNSVINTASIGTAVGLTAFSSDENDDVVYYTLLNDAGGRFQINTSSGVVTTKASLLGDTGQVFMVTVSASDMQSSSSATFNIAVYGSSNSAPALPVDENSSLNTVAENEPADSLVGITAFAFDPDEDPVTYSLTQNPESAFKIDPASGVVQTTKPLDHEAKSTYQITVQAFDGNLTSSASFVILVSDVDEMPTTPVDGSNQQDAVYENGNGGDFTGVIAFSQDPEGASVTYRLIDDASGSFAINSNNGQIRATRGFDFELEKSFVVTVEASDGNLISTANFYIQILNVNEPPGSISDTDLNENQIVENAVIGSVVGITAFAQDPDDEMYLYTDNSSGMLNGSSSIRYSLSSNNYFQIDEYTGVVTTAAKIDYETISEHSITVYASDGEYSSFQQYRIIVIDEDEVGNAPYTVQLISRDNTQIIGNGISRSPSINEDGTKIAYYSASSNFSDQDANGTFDIFLHDTITSQVSLISKTDNGASANDYSSNPDISGDGRFIVFESDASDLVEGDTNGLRDIFLYDTQLNKMIIVSKPSGDQANGASFEASISADGKWIVFHSAANNLDEPDINNEEDVFLYEIDTREITLISKHSGGEQGSGASRRPAISGDGRYIVYFSRASNLVDNDLNNTDDIFLYDRGARTTQRISESYSEKELDITSFGGDTNGSSVNPSISVDGTYIVYHSYATNIVEIDTNGRPDVFLYNRLEGSTQIVSSREDGTQSDGDSFNATVSNGGLYVAFTSSASSLVSPSGNDTFDILLWERRTGDIENISKNEQYNAGNADSYQADMRSDGQFVAFYSEAQNLVDDDANQQPDIFLFSMFQQNSAPSTPVDIDLVHNQVMENSLVGTTVGLQVESIDPNEKTMSYSLLQDAGGLFQIDASTGVVSVKGSVDYETSQSYDIIVVASNGSISRNALFSISILNNPRQIGFVITRQDASGYENVKITRTKVGSSSNNAFLITRDDGSSDSNDEDDPGPDDDPEKFSAEDATKSQHFDFEEIQNADQ